VAAAEAAVDAHSAATMVADLAAVAVDNPELSEL